MNSGFSIFVSIIGVLFVGVLVGSSMSFWGDSSAFWPAFGSIGAWVGGVGAVSAALIALNIANKQMQRDNYRLIAVKNIYYPNSIIYDKNDLMAFKAEGKESTAILCFEIANSGLRPIQVTLIHIEYKGFNFGLRIPDKTIIQPGCVFFLEVPSTAAFYDAMVLYDQSINGVTAFTCFTKAKIFVEDALGFKHEVKKKN